MLFYQPVVPSSDNIQVLQQSLSNLSLHQTQIHQPSVVQATPVSQLAQQQHQHLIGHTSSDSNNLLLSSANLNLRTGASQSVSQNNKFHDTTLGTLTNQQHQQYQQQTSCVPNQLLQQQQQLQQANLQDQDDEQFNQLNQKMLQLVATIPNYPLQKIVQRWCNDPKSPSESPPNCLNESLQSSPTKTSSKFSISGKYIFLSLLR